VPERAQALPFIEVAQEEQRAGAQREPLEDGYDVVICGASFAGLAAARELSGSGADVLLLDRHPIGGRPTSACGIPTDWLRELGMIGLELQRFGELVVNTPGGTIVLDMPFSFSTFNYDEMCWALWNDCDATFEVATVRGRGGERGGRITVDTDRGPVSAPLVIDASGWRRILAVEDGFLPPDGALTRALEVHPAGTGEDLEVWVDRRYVRAGYGWSFPAGQELRIGTCSYAPHDHVRKGTDRIAEDLGREQIRYQGNWIPHKLRPPTEGNVFFTGDSAGQCLPLTAEGIRTALYYGIAVGREMRAVFEDRQTRERAIAAYTRLHLSHRRGFGLLLFFQRLIPWIPQRLLAPLFRIYRSQPLVNLTFNGYLKIAPPGFAASPTGERPAERGGALREPSGLRV
jgi:flavin-dependent dehydrogenase